MTSFGQAVKGEIAQVTSGPCCRRVQLYALLLTAGRLEPDALTLRTESDAARAYAEAALNDCFGIRPQLKSADKGDGHIYTLRVSDADAARRIYAAYGFDPHAPFIRINGKLTAKDCCKTAFLRGMFLGCGTVTDPGKGYGRRTWRCCWLNSAIRPRPGGVAAATSSTTATAARSRTCWG